jgi:probable HAF family extracellular repeat protein
MKRTLIRLAACLGTVGTFHSLAFAAVLHGLGDLPGGGFDSIAVGVSADGTVVVGRSGVSGGSATFRWTRGGGMERVTVSADHATMIRATAISADGSTIVGIDRQSDTRACRLDGTGRLNWLTGAATTFDPSIAYAASADGSVVVGRKYTSGRFEAFRWTSADGLAGLGDLSGGDFFSVAFATSADGTVVVGAGNSSRGPEAFRWTQAEGMVGLGDLPGGAWCSEARATSADGSVVVGYSSSAAGVQAFRWTRTEGIVGLGDLPGGLFQSEALAVSADGSIIVGTSRTSTGGTAFIWTAAEGMRSLGTVLKQRGADVAGWQLLEATGISADGSVIVGYGMNPSGRTEAWRVDLDSDVVPTTYAPSEVARRAVVGPIVAIALVCGLAAWRWLRRGELRRDATRASSICSDSSSRRTLKAANAGPGSP